MNPTAWDTDRYDRQFGYVSHLATGVLELLAPRPGESVADLGCGTGELTEKIRAAGATVVAVDSDPAMVAAASRRLDQPAILADGHDFTLDEPVDAVFSNAALHWMTEPDRVLACVRRALRPGGRFVAELGAAHNVSTITDALRQALAEQGLAEQAPVIWYFPSPAEYAGRLERAGFRVARMEYFPRPTSLAECPNGVADWVVMFAGQLTAHVPQSRRAALLERVSELTAPVLYRDGTWYADYWRLRFVAIAEEPGSSGALG
jgi:trans-aconitate methyltransferase